MKSFLFHILTLFIVNSTIAQDYKRGKYYDQNNNKYEGYINEKFMSFDASALFQFKDSLSAIKRKVKKHEVSSYVIEEDSFAIIKDIYIGPTVYVESDFARVIESGKIGLYQLDVYIPGVPGAGGGAPVTYGGNTGYLILVKDGNSYRMSKPKDFKKTLPELVADSPKVFNSLLDKYNLEELRKLVINYNNEFPEYVSFDYKVFLYRHQYRQLDEKITLTINDSITHEFVLGSFVELEFQSATRPIKICFEGSSECLESKLNHFEPTYIECFWSKKTGKKEIFIPDTDQAEYNYYLSKEAQEKRLKKKKDNH